MRGSGALTAAEAEQAARRRRAVELAETARAAREELARARAGDWGDPRAHLRHEHRPIPPEEARYGRLVELWSAISVSLVLVATIALVVSGFVAPWSAVIVVIAAYAFVEAAFQRRLMALLLRLTLLLAVIGALVLAASYIFEAMVVALVSWPASSPSTTSASCAGLTAPASAARRPGPRHAVTGCAGEPRRDETSQFRRTPRTRRARSSSSSVPRRSSSGWTACCRPRRRRGGARGRS